MLPSDNHRTRLPLVAHVSTTFRQQWPGGDRVFHQLRALRDNGYRIALIVGRDFDPSPLWDFSGIDLYRIPSLVKHVDPVRDLWSIHSLLQIMRSIRPDAVHTHLAKGGILGRYAARLCRVPMILHTVHGPTFPPFLPVYKRMIYRALEQFAGRVTHRFVFVGEEIRDDYIRAGVCQRENSTVIRTGRPDAELEALNGISREKRNDLWTPCPGSRREPFLIVNVGRIVPSKQQEHALVILDHLRRSGVNAALVVVGKALVREEKKYVHRLKKCVLELKLGKYVRFMGYRDDVLELMAASDAVLHTSKYEGLPNILVEAALAKRPVVTYKVSGAGEVVDEGITGFIVSQGDIEGAVERLRFLSESSERRRMMGEAAFKTISDEYCESAMIQNMLIFYDKTFKAKSLKYNNGWTH